MAAAGHAGSTCKNVTDVFHKTFGIELGLSPPLPPRIFLQPHVGSHAYPQCLAQLGQLEAIGHDQRDGQCFETIPAHTRIGDDRYGFEFGFHRAQGNILTTGQLDEVFFAVHNGQSSVAA